MNFIGVHSNAITVDDMPKDFETFNKKMELFFAEVKLFSCENINNRLNVCNVVLRGVRIDDDVIHVDIHVYSDVRSKNVSHQCLIGCTAVAVPHLHDLTNHCSVRCSKQGVGNMFWFSLNLFILYASFPSISER